MIEELLRDVLKDVTSDKSLPFALLRLNQPNSLGVPHIGTTSRLLSATCLELARRAKSLWSRTHLQEQARPMRRCCRSRWCSAKTPPGLEGANALVVITKWNVFRAISPERLAAVLRDKIVVDLRNVYDPLAMERWSRLDCAVSPSAGAAAHRRPRGRRRIESGGAHSASHLTTRSGQRSPLASSWLRRFHSTASTSTLADALASRPTWLGRRSSTPTASPPATRMADPHQLAGRRCTST